MEERKKREEEKKEKETTCVDVEKSRILQRNPNDHSFRIIISPVFLSIVFSLSSIRSFPILHFLHSFVSQRSIRGRTTKGEKEKETRVYRSTY